MSRPVIFARPVHNYDPYGDVWSLMSSSKYEFRFMNQIDWNEDQIVIATPHNGEWEGVPADKKSKLIFWQLERPEIDKDYEGKDRLDRVDEVWCSDRAMATMTNARYVFFGGMPQFAQDPLEPIWDLITLAGHWGRRVTIHNSLLGLTRGDLPNGTWGQDRISRLRHSKLFMWCHQDNLLWSEPVRLMLGATYKIPMLCETCIDAGLFTPGVHYAQTDYEMLIPAARALINDLGCTKPMVEAAHQLVMHDHPFEQEVDRALQEGNFL